MKKVVLFTVLAIAFIKADAMSYEQARDQALFLTDKMAYELNLTPEQYDAAYEINLDYLMGITTADDVFGTYWEHRNVDFGYILLDWQYRTFMDCLWFYRPLYWDSGFWHFRIYGRYPHRDWFYFEHRTIVVTYTGGGHCWRTHGRSWYCGRTFGHPDRIGSGGSGMRNNWNGRGHRYTSSSQVNGQRSSNSLSSVRGSERGTFSGSGNHSGSFSGSSNHSGSFSKSTDSRRQGTDVGQRATVNGFIGSATSPVEEQSSNTLFSGRGSGRGSFSEQRSVIGSKVENNTPSSKRVQGRGSFSGQQSTVNSQRSTVNSQRSTNSLSSGRGSGRGSFSGQQSVIGSKVETNSLSSGRGSGRGSFSSSHSGSFSGGRSSGSFSSGRSGGGHGGFSGGHSGGGRR